MKTISFVSAENEFGDIQMENISGMANKRIEDTFFKVALSLIQTFLPKKIGSGCPKEAKSGRAPHTLTDPAQRRVSKFIQ